MELSNFDEVVQGMSMVQLPIEHIEELLPTDGSCVYAEETRAISEEGCRLLLSEALRLAECRHCAPRLSPYQKEVNRGRIVVDPVDSEA